jgi:hypothetical protein
MTDNKYLEAVLRDQTFAPGSPELEALQKRRKEVEELLRAEFGSAPRIREGGSKAKGTMIKESYDLDLTCYFGHEDDEAGNSLKELYNNTEGVLAREYKTVRKGSAIRIYDLQAGTDFHVDVVPGRFVDGKDGDVFLYQSSGDKERLKTNLDVHIDHVRDSGVTEAIRLMKLWRVRNKIEVKTFVLELLIIKLLLGKEDQAIATQLQHVWEQVRDHADGLAVEDPANPSGNDLSDLLNTSVRAQLSSAAARTLDVIEDSGWQAIFGEVQSDEEDDTAALKRIAVITPIKSKPWTSVE